MVVVCRVSKLFEKISIGFLFIPYLYSIPPLTLYDLNLLSYLSFGYSIFVGGRSLAFYLIGSIFGRISTDEHRHRHEQEPLVSGVEKINMVREDSIE